MAPGRIYEDEKIDHRHTPPEGRTDRTRWRLLDEDGRHTWHYVETDEQAKEWPQSTADKHFLNLPMVCLQSCVQPGHSIVLVSFHL
jgi:hypothetical protein